MELPKNQNEIIELFKNGPALLENALDSLGDIELDYTPLNNGWSIREIIHHISDGDDIWKAFIKIALGNHSAEFTLKWYLTLPQTEWTKRWSYKQRSINSSLSLLKANREHILQLLEYSKDAWTKSAQFLDFDGEIKSVPIGFVIKMQADHLVHHVNRMIEIRKEFSGS